MRTKKGKITYYLGLLHYFALKNAIDGLKDRI